MCWLANTTEPSPCVRGRSLPQPNYFFRPNSFCMYSMPLAPPPEALAERYAERSGTSIDDLPWYEVFSRWKLAIVLEGSYAKFLRGESDNPVHEAFGATVDQALARATEFIDQR